MSGVVGGWVSFLLFNVVGMAVVCLLLALAMRHFLRGTALIAVTVALSFIICLGLAASGMAASDFNLLFVAPFALCASIVAGIWLITSRMQVHRG